MRKILFLLIACLTAGNISIYILGAPAGGNYDGSDWAKKEISQAVEKGLVPDELQYNYKNNITRAEFCKLCVSVMKAWNSDINPTSNKISFSDTNDEDVLICADMGIVNGVGNNNFAPNNPIKRQEAARMLYNTLFVGTSVIQERHIPDKLAECCIPHSFDDGALIQSWARDEISHMYRFGVMLGVDNNNYNPDGYYSREQAICTFLRLYNCKDNISLNPVPESDYYPYGSFVCSYFKDGHASAESFDFNAEYIDSSGKKYTSDEKGYVYPFNYPCSVFLVNSGVGVGAYIVADKNGDTFLPGSFESVDLTPYSALCERKSDFTTELYKLPEKKKVFENVWPIGDNLYLQERDEDNLISVVNLNGDTLVDLSKGYIGSRMTTCFSGVFVLENKDGFLSIINSKGEILKNFTVDPSWNFYGSVGSNVIFDIQEKGFVLYRAFSEKSFTYDSINLTENNEAIAINNYDTPSEKNYILNSDGSVKFEFGRCETIKKLENSNLYFINRKEYKDSVKMVDYIINENGNVIKTISDEKDFKIDKSGVCAYISNDNVINFFDFFGKDLGKFDLSGYNKTGNPSIKFIHGLLWVNTHDENNNANGFYVTPYGKILK